MNQLHVQFSGLNKQIEEVREHESELLKKLDVVNINKTKMQINMDQACDRIQVNIDEGWGF